MSEAGREMKKEEREKGEAEGGMTPPELPLDKGKCVLKPINISYRFALFLASGQQMDRYYTHLAVSIRR